MNRISCSMCDAMIYPYCPNPDQIVWMCENEDWLFPFGEDPETVQKVCTLRPQYSVISLAQQVHLVQQGTLSSSKPTVQKCANKDWVDVQEDIRDSMCKLNEFLTSYKQADIGYMSDDLEFHNITDEAPIDQFLQFDDGSHNQPGIEFSVDSEPIFRVEKVCRKNFPQYLSYADLDCPSDNVSASASLDEYIPELNEEVEMEVEQDLFDMKGAYDDQKLCCDEDKSSLWSSKSNTHSCTHSHVG